MPARLLPLLLLLTAACGDAPCKEPGFEPVTGPRTYTTDHATLAGAMGDDATLDADECVALCEQLEAEGAWEQVTGCQTSEVEEDTGTRADVVCDGTWAPDCPS